MIDTLADAYRRLRFRSILESSLKQELGGIEYHLPIFETDAEQQFRNHPDYEQLCLEYYANPELVEPLFEHEIISYTISDMTVREPTGVIYKTKRLLGDQSFRGKVELHLDFGELELANLRMDKFHEVKEIQAVFSYYKGDSEATIYHDFESVENLIFMLLLFNRYLARAWDTPSTFEELIEYGTSWMAYDAFKERFR